MVKPLPESLFSFIWDYGQLSRAEELQIIEKIVSQINQTGGLDSPLSADEIYIISRCLIVSQDFTRFKEARWAVSLRDVSRFANLFCYFYKDFSDTSREA